MVPYSGFCYGLVKGDAEPKARILKTNPLIRTRQERMIRKMFHYLFVCPTEAEQQQGRKKKTNKELERSEQVYSSDNNNFRI